MDERDSIIFLKTWLDAIEKYIDGTDAQNAFIAEIVRSGIRNIEPHTEVEKGLMYQIGEHIRRNHEKHERLSEAGRKGGSRSQGGGAPMGNQNAKKQKQQANNKQSTSKQQRNVNDNDNVNVNVNDNVNNNACNRSLKAHSASKKKMTKREEDEMIRGMSDQEYNEYITRKCMGQL